MNHFLSLLWDPTDLRASQIPTAITDTQLAPTLKAHDVGVTGVGVGSALLEDILSFVPFLLFIAFFTWLGRRSARQLAGGIMGFGGSRANVYDEGRPTTRFSDIAGYEGAKREVSEVVDFLSHPKRYARAGATGPRAHEVQQYSFGSWGSGPPLCRGIRHTVPRVSRSHENPTD